MAPEDPLLEMAGMMRTFRSDMEALDGAAARIARRTTLLIRAGIVILVVAITFIFYLVYTLSDDMASIHGYMQDTLSSLFSMSLDMDDLTKSVDRIGRHVETVPVIAGAMESLGRDMAHIERSVHAIKDKTASLKQNMTKVDGMTNEMGRRFVNVGNTVNHMQYNVNHMARPSDMFSPFYFMMPLRQ